MKMAPRKGKEKRERGGFESSVRIETRRLVALRIAFGGDET
jgi:hypothetical protein